MQGLIFKVVLVLLVLLGLGWGVQQYGARQELAQELSSVRQASEIAQERLREFQAVDVAQTKQIAVQRQRVRSAVNTGRAQSAQITQNKVPSGSCSDAAGIRVFNDSINAVNAAVSDSGELPR